jgi:hypothetical protein
MAESTLTLALDTPAANPSQVPPTESGQTEFDACLQLLVERAAFLTAADAVRITIPLGDSFISRAATGAEAPAIENSLDRLQACFAQKTMLRVSAGNGRFRLLAPIGDDGQPVGVFDFISKYEFSEDDVKAINRIADLAGVAFTHNRAANKVAAGDWEELRSVPPPSEWHAPEVSRGPSQTSAVQPAMPAEVKSCSACGFPVSPGRTLCVECEQKPHGPASAPGEIFSLQSQESWLSEHGYTLASILISALAAALIFWLRR